MSILQFLIFVFTVSCYINRISSFARLNGGNIILQNFYNSSIEGSNSLFNMSGKEKECAHKRHILGKRQKNDLQIEKDIINVKSSFLRKSKVIYSYPHSDETNSNTLTFINVTNSNVHCNCFNNKVNFVRGGPGKCNIIVEFESERSCALYYIIEIFAK